ncbi:MAG: malate synthase A [Rudaea sp.]
MSVAVEYLENPGVEISATPQSDYAAILTPAALAFLAELHRRFDSKRLALLAARVEQQARFDAGELPDFLPETRLLRESDWTVAEIPATLRDRRIEITGPVERKTIINALNSGANVFMADFEDSTTPTWTNLIAGQINLRDAVNGSIAYRSAQGREYRLDEKPAILMVRPRGWHLPEKHARIDGVVMSGALLDFGLYIFHNGKILHSSGLHGGGNGLYLYLPKLQSHREAALWDEVIEFAEHRLGLPIGAIKVTVLIETLPAALQMHEILYALRCRCVALNCGRWDYIFSYLKTFRRQHARVLPERGQVTMTVPFLKAYSELLIQTCHRRGALAMGGMAAQIPIRDDAMANASALEKFRADKLREVRAGHDGTWVAHPALVPVAREIFDAHMQGANQVHVARADVRVTRDDLIAPSAGTITREGWLNNIDVCVRYLAAWLDGLGCVPIHNLMEDAATAEIACAQLWQWLHAGDSKFVDGGAIDDCLFDAALLRVHERLPTNGLPGQTRIAQAASLLGELVHADELADFLTQPAYAQLA